MPLLWSNLGLDRMVLYFMLFFDYIVNVTLLGILKVFDSFLPILFPLLFESVFHVSISRHGVEYSHLATPHSY